MKRKTIKRLSILAFAFVLLSLGSCGGKKEIGDPTIKGKLNLKEKDTSILQASNVETEQKEDVETSKVEEVSETAPEKKELTSLLTGLPLDKKLEKKRPYAFMFNNIKFAYPQNETSKAGILYEILAEGGITRLMGIFDEMTGERIGSVRSARHYYVDFAKEFDAYFIYFGQTKYAISEMKKLKIDTLSGLSKEGYTIFYRDPNIKAPHNAFAKASGIEKAIQEKGYRRELKEDMTAHFHFSYEKELHLEKEDSFEASYVSVPFSAYMTPYFTFENGTYTRYAFGVKHIDKTNQEALTFKNILIQFVNEYNIDKNGYQTMDLIGHSGEAFYLTNGRGKKVYWKKTDGTSKTRFYTNKEHTEEISVNVGKTYYGVLPKDRMNQMKFTK